LAGQSGQYMGVVDFIFYSTDEVGSNPETEFFCALVASDYAVTPKCILYF
jgi:hypothetical protein